MQSYHIRKKEREIKDKNKIKGILKGGKYATISMCREKEPYIVTLSYGFDEEQYALYFHSANLGLKLDILKENQIESWTYLKASG